MARWLAFGLTLLVLLTACFLVRGPVCPGDVRAATITTIVADTDDGRVAGVSTVYTTARSTSTACLAGGSGSLAYGQRLFSSEYYVWQGYVGFDTSGLVGGSVSTATMCVYLGADTSTTDFQLLLYRWAWSSPLCTYTETNYDGTYGGSSVLEGVLFDTASGSLSGTWRCVSVDPAGVNRSGYTRYSWVSDRVVSNTIPTGNEYVFVYPTESGNAPYLSVSWTEPTPTPTSSPTPTRTPTPTVTPICPALVSSNTTWGPGTVRISCNVGVTNGVTLTLAAGTEVRFIGQPGVDVAGKLYAVGTSANPITLTHDTGVMTGSWGYLYLRGQPSVLDYVNVLYGGGVNDEAGSTFTHCNFKTNMYGLALRGPQVTTVTSCTLQYNDVGLLPYGYSVPVMSASNVLSNTLWDACLVQEDSVTASGCWWGAATPPAAKVWDYSDDFRLGIMAQDAPAGAWVVW